jgi:hypothetical protein
MNTAEKIARTLPLYWRSLITKTERRRKFFRILSIAILIFFLVVILDYFSSGQEFTIWKVRWLIWSALFAGAVWFIDDERISNVLFYAMIVALIIINYFLWIIPLLFLVYALYLILEANRMKRLKEIAESSPEQLAGIKDPKIVIRIRKD